MNGGREMDDRAALEELEIRLLLDGIHQRYGYDFRDYATASLRRRIRKTVHSEGLQTISALQDRVLHDPACMDRIVTGWSVNVTAMFRNPRFFAVLRSHVLPVLRTYPYSRIWVAGCASGEEVYSLAIMLAEDGLAERCRIYATDLNAAVLDRARQGIFPLASMRQYTANYQQAGGERPFSDLYVARYDNAIFDPELRRNVVFSLHNLVTDASFNEFHLILCRNVLIYFNRQLQGRVVQLFLDSLLPQGFLGLGGKESVRFLPQAGCFEDVERGTRLYRRIDG